MSAIVLAGRPFAAGLYWLDRAGLAATAGAARRFSRPWCVHRAGQTGYASGVEDTGEPGTPASPEGLPALALALIDSIESDFWMALVAGDAVPGDAGGGDTARFALIKVRDGAVLADGDEVFTGRDAAVEAFKRARTLGWNLYATPGLLRGGADRDVAELDVSGLAAGPETALRRAPFTGIRRGHLALFLLLPAALAAVAAIWLHRDALVAWIAGPEPVAETPAEPDLAVAVDSVALIEACRRALIDYPPWLPAWRIESLSCAARFAEPELAALRPELAGRAVMLARWRLAPGHAVPLQRQLAEQHLSRWYAASVADAQRLGGDPAGAGAAHRGRRAAFVSGAAPRRRPRSRHPRGTDRLRPRPARRLDRPGRASRPAGAPRRSFPRGRRPRGSRDHQAGPRRGRGMAPAWPPRGAGGDGA